MHVLQAEDFEPVLVRILDVIVVGNPGALGAPVIERIVAARLTPVFVSQVGLSAQRLDRLIDDRARLAGIIGVVQIDGCGGLARQRSRGGGASPAWPNASPDSSKIRTRRFMILFG